MEEFGLKICTKLNPAKTFENFKFVMLANTTNNAKQTIWPPRINTSDSN